MKLFIQKNFSIVIAIIIMLTIIMVFISNIVLAAIEGGSVESGIALPNPIGNDLLQILKRIIGWLIGLAIPVASLLILIAGYQIMFAGGDPEKIKIGKSTILYTIIGLAIIILSWGFVDIAQRLLGIK